VAGPVAALLVGLCLTAVGGFAWFFSDDMADAQYRKERGWAFFLDREPPDEEESTRRWSALARTLSKIQVGIGA
jgi:hypothetical protein